MLPTAVRPAEAGKTGGGGPRLARGGAYDAALNAGRATGNESDMTATTLTSGADPVAPSAPSRKLRAWPRRHKFATFILSLLVLTLVVRLTWGWYCGRQLAAALSELRDRGEPTSASEIVVEPLHASENAWNVYAQAIAALKPGVDSPRNSGLEYPTYPPYGAEWEELAAASEQAHSVVFGSLRRARGLERSLTPPNTNSLTLARTLADGAQYAHLRGDDAEAVERLVDTLHLARSVRQGPTLASQLTGIGVGAIAADAAQQIVPTARLDRSPGATPATSAQFRALTAALLDERQTGQWMEDALRSTRVTMLETLRQQAADTWAIRPLADRTAVRWLRDFDALLKAAEHGHAEPARRLRQLKNARPASFSILPGPGDYENRVVPRYSRWFEEYDPLNLARSLEQHYRVSAERRATAVIVAVRLYRHDHGRWPDDAAALVPNYLDALPADPFRSDGAPIGYVLLRGALSDGGDRPMVYFELGEGDEELIDTEPMYGWQSYYDRRTHRSGHEIRQYRDVSYWLPETRRFYEERKRIQEAQKELEEAYRLQEAVDDDPAEPDAPREDSKNNDAADDPADQ